MFNILAPATIFKRISERPYYLVGQYFYDCLLWGTLAVLAFFNIQRHEWSYHYTDLVVVILAIIMGWLVSSFIHNTAHNNIKNKYINRLVGEFCGLWVMYGFKNFILIHILHHKYSDQELDPVNPKGMSFFKFLTAPMRYMIRTGSKYMELKHGEHRHFKMIKFGHYFFFHLSVIARLFFFYSVLGGKYFVIFYMVSLASNISILAHINYICHKELPNGDVEILNFDHNIYYKVANLITCGGYYHKNHHLNQNLFDPRELKTKRSEERLIKESQAETFSEAEQSSKQELYWKSILRL